MSSPSLRCASTFVASESQRTLPFGCFVQSVPAIRNASESKNEELDQLTSVTVRSFVSPTPARKTAGLFGKGGEF